MNLVPSEYGSENLKKQKYESWNATQNFEQEEMVKETFVCVDKNYDHGS